MWNEQANWGSPRKAAPLAPQASIPSAARSISDEEERAGLTQQLELLKDFSRQLGQKVIERDGQLAGTSCQCLVLMEKSFDVSVMSCRAWKQIHQQPS